MISLHRIVFFCTCLVCVVSCGAKSGGTSESKSKVETIRQTAAQMQDTGHLFQLKNLMINADYVFPDGEHVRGVKMDDAVIGKFKPENIDEFFAMGDTYYVVDTIATSTYGSVYFILKYDPNETTGWLVIYDQKMKVMDQIEVYYENAEGNFYLTSSILDNIVTAAGDNITPEENPVSAFRIVKGPRWQIIEH
ncbi:MAG TPA: hypothetical protein VI603_00310 [Saprospiraceae bacterium]|nr:hypothetical protein [Saprospiraceae bacterium]